MLDRRAAIERQLFALHLADAAARDVDDAVAGVWSAVEHHAALLPRHQARPQLLALAHVLLPVASAAIRLSLSKITRWGLADAARRVTSSVRKPHLVAANIVQGRLMESEASVFKIAAKMLGVHPQVAGISIDLVRQAVAAADDLTKIDLSHMLFPLPEKAEVDEIVYANIGGMTWADRLRKATKTSASPAQIASVISTGFTTGKTVPEMARELLPIVDEIKSTAKRIARTEGMRVALHTQEKQWDSLGDMVIGYQVHAVADDGRSRRSNVFLLDHRRRDGTKFYKKPRPGQYGLDDCPHPPLESKNFGYEYAWNCRCTLSPLLNIS